VAAIALRRRAAATQYSHWPSQRNAAFKAQRHSANFVSANVHATCSHADILHSTHPNSRDAFIFPVQ